PARLILPVRPALPAGFVPILQGCFPASAVVRCCPLRVPFPPQTIRPRPALPPQPVPIPPVPLPQPTPRASAPLPPPDPAPPALPPHGSDGPYHPTPQAPVLPRRIRPGTGTGTPAPRTLDRAPFSHPCPL